MSMPPAVRKQTGQLLFDTITALIERLTASGVISIGALDGRARDMLSNQVAEICLHAIDTQTEAYQSAGAPDPAGMQHQLRIYQQWMAATLEHCSAHDPYSGNPFVAELYERPGRTIDLKDYGLSPVTKKAKLPSYSGYQVYLPEQLVTAYCSDMPLAFICFTPAHGTGMVRMRSRVIDPSITAHETALIAQIEAIEASRPYEKNDDEATTSPGNEDVPQAEEAPGRAGLLTHPRFGGRGDAKSGSTPGVEVSEPEPPPPKGA